VDKSSHYKELGQQLTSIQRRLYLYIVSLMGNPTDAEDVLQEANRVIWEKAEEFTPGTNLTAWAFRIARFEVMTWRKQKGRENLRFSDALLDQLADEATAAMAEVNPRRDALHHCLDKLNESDRAMISSRYLAEASVHQVAEEFGRSEKSIYQSMARIRVSLLDCIERQTNAEDRP